MKADCAHLVRVCLLESEFMALKALLQRTRLLLARGLYESRRVFSDADDAALRPMEAAQLVGKAVAERAKTAGIEAVVFDRGGYKYHGRVKALADAAREGGLSF